MDFDLIIVGGGLAGAALAVALGKSRLKIALVDGARPQKAAGWDTRIYAYTPASARFLQDIGVWERLDHARLCPVDYMEVHGDRGGRLDFAARECGLTELAWIGEADLLLTELWESLTRQHNVTVFAPAAPARLDHGTHAVELTLDDGRGLSAALLVGADGRDSWVRQAVGIKTHSRPYHQQAVVANFRCEHFHRRVAWQWFRADGVVAWLPLPGNMFSLVWSAPDEIAAELMALPDEAFCQRVAAAGGCRLGGLALETPRAAFALRFMRVADTVAARVALVGDAAHAIHPLSGHGINLGFQDARSLAELLIATEPWQDVGEFGLLRRHARARAEEPFMLQYATDGIHRLFASRNPVLGCARNVGLSLTARLPPLTRLLARYAAQGPHETHILPVF
ncbi:MAG: UbiH/UbiF family hydroxylase [Azoarcus sp.]|nr:UbiH/UbiF family hydroxylase [Azoarcus sp.]